MAVMVSKQGHCLIDMLWRWEAGELDAEIRLVISNHDDLAPKVEAHGIPFSPPARDHGIEGRAGGEG